jgi:hypothetical protein
MKGEYRWNLARFHVRGCASTRACFEPDQNVCGKREQVCHTGAHVIGKFTPEGARARFHARFSAPDGDGCLLRSSCLPVI